MPAVMTGACPMFFDEVKERDAAPRQQAEARGDQVSAASGAQSPGGKWHEFPNSQISHHGATCCDIAHEWLLAFDFAQLNGADVLSGPRWMREHSAWGPTVWPIHWC